VACLQSTRIIAAMRCNARVRGQHQMCSDTTKGRIMEPIAVSLEQSQRRSVMSVFCFMVLVMFGMVLATSVVVLMTAGYPPADVVRAIFERGGDSR
jgi:hypothetical protein